MTRPTKLTPQVRATILGGLAQGLPFAEACRLAGVSSSAAYEWLARGRGEDSRRPPSAECVEFANALEAAGFADASEQPDNPATSSESQRNAEIPASFADTAEPVEHPATLGCGRLNAANPAPFADEFSDTKKEKPSTEEPAASTGPTGREWASQRSRSRSILDMEF